MLPVKESPRLRQPRLSKHQYRSNSHAPSRGIKPSTASRTQADSSGFQSSFERTVVPPKSQRSMQSLKPRMQSSVNLQATIEVYECGCKIHYRVVDFDEFEGDLPQTLVLIPEYSSCQKHASRGQEHSNPPPDARLVTVLHENESYLNE